MFWSPTYFESPVCDMLPHSDIQWISCMLYATTLTHKLNLLYVVCYHTHTYIESPVCCMLPHSHIDWISCMLHAITLPHRLNLLYVVCYHTPTYSESPVCYILVHDYTLCFIGSLSSSVSYYNYISVWPYYIVIELP